MFDELFCGSRTGTAGRVRFFDDPFAFEGGGAVDDRAIYIVPVHSEDGARVGEI